MCLYVVSHILCSKKMFFRDSKRPHHLPCLSVIFRGLSIYICRLSSFGLSIYIYRLSSLCLSIYICRLSSLGLSIYICRLSSFGLSIYVCLFYCRLSKLTVYYSWENLILISIETHFWTLTHICLLSIMPNIFLNTWEGFFVIMTLCQGLETPAANS